MSKKIDQNPDHYLVIRVRLVEVKKLFLIGLKDKNISSTAFVPNTQREALELFKLMKEFGKKFMPDHVEVKK